MDWEVFAAQKKYRQEEGQVRRNAATESLSRLAKMAVQYGVIVRRHSDTHYSIMVLPYDGSPWRWNVYPGNCRASKDHRYPATPFIPLTSPWTLESVVQAVIQEKVRQYGQ